jgi:hypothetical protein
MIFFVVMRHHKEGKTLEYPATCGGADRIIKNAVLSDLLLDPG